MPIEFTNIYSYIRSLESTQMPNYKVIIYALNKARDIKLDLKENLCFN